MTRVLITESLQMETLKAEAAREGVKVCYEPPIPADGDMVFHYRPDIPVKDLQKNLPEYDGLVVRPRLVTGEMIAGAASRLKLIVRGGAGMNAIDVETAKKHNIIVENTPGENAVSTAEFTFNLIMDVLGRRQIMRSDADTRSHKAGLPSAYEGVELMGKKLAIIGMGNIGQKVAKMAAGFDMQVLYYSRRPKNLPYTYYASVNALLDAGADVVSLHAPLTPETDAMLDDAAFARMKPGTVLINCARPQLVSPESFKKALEKGVLKSFAIDGDPDLVEPFVQADPERKGLITHHIADSTFEAQANITRQVIKQLLAYFREGKEINRVV